MQYLSIKDLLLKERKKNAVVIAKAAKNASDIDYIAMMCDVELEVPEEEDTIQDEVEEA